MLLIMPLPLPLLACAHACICACSCACAIASACACDFASASSCALARARARQTDGADVAATASLAALTESIACVAAEALERGVATAVAGAEEEAEAVAEGAGADTEDEASGEEASEVGDVEGHEAAETGAPRQSRPFPPLSVAAAAEAQQAVGPQGGTLRSRCVSAWWGLVLSLPLQIGRTSSALVLVQRPHTSGQVIGSCGELYVCQLRAEGACADTSTCPELEYTSQENGP